MTISLIDATTSASLPLLLPGAAGATDSVEGDFSALFARLMADATQNLIGQDASFPGFLAEAQMLSLPEAVPLLPGLDALSTEALSLLPENWQEAARRSLSRDKEEVDATEVPSELLGALPLNAAIPETLTPEQSRPTLSLLGGKPPSENGQTNASGESDAEEVNLLRPTGSDETAKIAVKPDESAPRPIKLPVTSATQEPLPLQMNASGESASRVRESTQPVAHQLSTSIQDSRWRQEFGEKIVWMVKNGEQQARLSLHPAHLGPLQIHLDLDASKVSATITAVAATSEARQAIEEALPRLREMLAGSGISLGEAKVGTQSRQENAFASGNQGEASSTSSRNGFNEAILGESVEAARISYLQRGDGLVDLFA